MYLRQKTGLRAKHGEKISTCRSPQNSERPGKMKNKYDARSAEKNYNFEPLGHKTRTLGYQIGKPGNWLNLGAGCLRPDWDTRTPDRDTGTPDRDTGTPDRDTGTPDREPPGAGGGSSVFPHTIRTL